MTYLGKVSGKGMVSLPPEADLAVGTEVLVEVIEDKHGGRTLHEKFVTYAGMADDLPADLAENHDHYLHGHPRK